MVTKEDIISCYKYILGREPENDEVVFSHTSSKNLEVLRKNFFESKEFRDSFKRFSANPEHFFPHQVWHTAKIDSTCDGNQLSQMMSRIRREWEDFGKHEPHWSVLTHEEYKKEQINNSFEKFYETGKYPVEIILAFFKRHHIKYEEYNNCFELGCGVGRITIHLSNLFPRIIAADISSEHLSVLKDIVIQKQLCNIEILHLTSPLGISEIGSLDFFCSFITLQHNPPPIIRYILNIVLFSLRPGGSAVFQLPTWIEGYSFDIVEYLERPKPLNMEMHALPQEILFEIIDKNNCIIKNIREDGWADGRKSSIISNTFFVVKR